MTRKNRSLLLVSLLLGAAVVIILLLIIIKQIPVTKKPATSQKGWEPGASEKPLVIPVTDSNATSSDVFRAEVPVGIKVPEVNEKVADKNVAVPNTVVPAAPGVTAKYRSFTISGIGGHFEPSEIRAKQGDTVNIKFTAVDNTYDIIFPSYRMGQTAKKGETKVVEFQALKSGSFDYYCQICGGPDSEAKGKIIIVE